MSYTDLRDFEPEATFKVPALLVDDKPLTIKIEKAGGGTIGKSYTGTWRTIVTYNRREVLRTQEMSTAVPHTHQEFAVLVAEYLAADSMGEGWTREMSNANEERLQLWASSPGS